MVASFWRRRRTPASMSDFGLTPTSTISSTASRRFGGQRGQLRLLRCARRLRLLRRLSREEGIPSGFGGPATHIRGNWMRSHRSTSASRGLQRLLSVLWR